MTTAPTKIVIVAGQRFAVPAETDNEVIRQQLVGMGFADVASAEVKRGKDGESETVEFIKKAGTKGLDGAGLAALLARVPHAPAPDALALPRGMHPGDRRVLQRLAAGDLTFADAVALELRTLLAAADVTASRADAGASQARRQGEVLCTRCDQVPAAAAPSVW